MNTDDRNHGGSRRRERAARGAFYLWMAAYAAVVIAIVTVHAISGASEGTQSGHTQQATRAGVSLGPVIPVAQADVNG